MQHLLSILPSQSTLAINTWQSRLAVIQFRAGHLTCRACLASADVDSLASAGHAEAMVKHKPSSDDGVPVVRAALIPNLHPHNACHVSAQLILTCKRCNIMWMQGIGWQSRTSPEKVCARQRGPTCRQLRAVSQSP